METSKDAGQVGRHERALREGTSAEKQAAAKALEALVSSRVDISLALPALHECLADRSVEVRLSAVDALTAIWRKPAAAQLGYYASAIDGLRATDPKDRISAASWLADITQPDMVRDRDERDISFAVPALAAAIFDEDPDVAVAALGALACAAADRQGIDQAIPAIITALDRCPDQVRVKAALTLRAAVEEKLDIGPHLPVLRSLLTSNNEKLKWAAADVLTIHHAQKERWEELVALLSHPDKDVRQETAGTLAHGYAINYAEVMPALLGLLDERDEELRLVAARTVARGARTMIDLFKALPITLVKLGSPVEESRVYAAGVLSSIVRRAVDLTTGAGNERNTAGTWQPIDDSVPGLAPRLVDPSPKVRADVARALAIFFNRVKRGDDLVAMLERLDEATLKVVLNSMRYSEEKPLPEYRAFLDARQGADLVARFKKAESTGQAELNMSAASLDAVPIHVLPPEIGLVTSLTRLDLSHNRISELPPEIGKLGKLEILIASSNMLESLPAQIGQLASLKQLFLYNNKLKGLPPEIGNLGRLDYLQLVQNALESLPAEFTNLKNLVYLSLERNRLHALPAGFGKLASLKSLDLRNNVIQSLPEDFAGLQSLETLSLCGNAMKEIPPAVFELVNLKYLYMTSSKLTRIPQDIVRLRNLETVGLRNNHIGELPDGLFDLPNLGYVDLANNRLSTIPRGFTRLKKLRWLELWGNSIDMPGNGLRRTNQPAAILKAYFSEQP